MYDSVSRVGFVGKKLDMHIGCCWVGSWSGNWLVLGHLVYGLINANLLRLAGYIAELIISSAQYSILMGSITLC
jgi:hypothetical protein